MFSSVLIIKSILLISYNAPTEIIFKYLVKTNSGFLCLKVPSLETCNFSLFPYLFSKKKFPSFETVNTASRFSIKKPENGRYLFFWKLLYKSALCALEKDIPLNFLPRKYAVNGSKKFQYE